MDCDPMSGEEAARWGAVVRRDWDMDGQFVYAVRTTGVYCRPSCASRPKRREHVRFYTDATQAEAAGFRACLRCAPNGISPTERRVALVEAACRRLADVNEVSDLDSLARAAGISRFHFHRVFKAVTGITPRAYAAERRAERVRGALGTAGSVTEAIYGAGFNASSRFYAEAPAALGMTPSRYRAEGRSERIRFAVARCALGTVLVATSERGVCAILLGDEPAALEQDLRRRFARADLLQADAALASVVASVIAWIDRGTQASFLSLDMRGTVFQRRVWAALADIPEGRTATYAEVAAAVGRPGAARAVAGACATNALAVAVPCHRVVRSDGSVAGYRWGVARKHALLTQERAGRGRS
jgi:AraC family transcriptional regulator of adaptative response/methylated-DNA-[protein]-cysteine methyltransferase